MSEKEPSGALPDFTSASQPASAAPGGPFPQGPSAENVVLEPPGPSSQFTLQFLIEIIKNFTK